MTNSDVRSQAFSIIGAGVCAWIGTGSLGIGISVSLSLMSILAAIENTKSESRACVRDARLKTTPALQPPLKTLRKNQRARIAR